MRALLIVPTCVALLTGCADDGAVDVDPATTATDPPAADASPTDDAAPTEDAAPTDDEPPTSTEEASDRVQVDESDTGGTVAVTVGGTVTLRLDSAWRWSEPVVDGGQLLAVPVSYESDPGYQEWELDAQVAGRAEVTSEGTARCDDGEDCPDDRTFTLTIEVVG